MKNFIKLLLPIYSTLLLPLVFPAFAANDDPCPKDFKNLCKIGPDQNPNLFGNIIAVIFIISIIVSIIFLIWGGIRWIMSSGDKAKLEQARSTIIAAIIGLIISLLGYFIVNLIVSLFTGQSSLNLTIPKL